MTVEPPFRDRGIGQALIARALDEAKAKGHRLVCWSATSRITARPAFRLIPKGQVTLGGPVDPARLLVAELAPGAFDGVGGVVRPDWELSAFAFLICVSRAKASRRRRLTALARPGRREAPTSSSSPSRPANIGSTPMPRTTLASRIFKPIQSSP